MYKAPINRILLYPFCVVTLLVGFALLLVPRGGVAVHVLVATICLATLWLTRQVTRMGLEVNDDGLVLYGVLTTVRVKWAEVVCFEAIRWGISRVVIIKRVKGRFLYTSLLQGRSVRWEGGKTKDILSILNREFDARRRVFEPSAAGS